MRKILKLGFVGGGGGSTIGLTHYISRQLDGKWKVVAGFFSRNKKDNLKTAATWNIDKSRVYQNLNDFIKSEKTYLDVGVVLTPTPNHFEILKKLLNEKISIICEKPLVDDFNKIKVLKKIITNKNFLRVTYNYTGYPMIRSLKDMIFNGELG